MTIFTSYFAKSGSNPRAVAISRSIPSGMHIKQIKPLAPDWDTLNRYKSDGDWEAYTKSYLSKLDSLGIDYILTLINDGDILLCYEKPPKNCHRHLLAEWLRKYNINVQEV